MNIDWYVFEESYLLDLNYNICNSKIIISLDAKKSKQHPEANEAKLYEDTFEELQVVLNGVVYYRGVTNENLQTDPNDDMGSVYRMQIDDTELKDDGIRFSYQDSLMKITLDNNNQVISDMFSKPKNIKFIEFISEMIAFRAAYTDCMIKVI